MADVSVAGVTVPVSGGDLAGGWDKDQHIDDNTLYNATWAWASLQANNGSPDTADGAWIGIDLGEGVTATLTGIVLTQSSNSNNTIEGADSVDFEYSQNGSDWTLHEAVSPTSASRSTGEEVLAFAADCPSARFFRLNANANPPGPAGSVWGVAEVQYTGTIDAAGGGGGGAGLGSAASRRRRRR